MIIFEEHRSNKNNYIYHQNDVNLSFGKHMHNSFEFIYVYEGELSCDIEGKNYCVKCGHGVLILPNQLHSYATLNFSKSYLCVFSYNFVNDFYKSILNCELDPPIIKISDVSFIDKLPKIQNDVYLIKAQLYNICSLIKNNCIYIKKEQSNASLLEKLIYYFQENYTKDISLGKVAKEFGYSYNYLSAFINKNLGCNFSTFINNLRIEYATYLLAHDEYSVTEISSKCGFDTIRSFNRAFIFSNKITPTQFKLNLTNS